MYRALYDSCTTAYRVVIGYDIHHAGAASTAESGAPSKDTTGETVGPRKEDCPR